MFSRVLCAFCLLASPAAAIEITSDYLIGADNVPIGQTINVRGDAKLTIASPEDGVHGLSAIHLFDNSQLEVLQGQLRGTVYVRGTNGIVVRGGTVTNVITGTGNADIEIHGGLINFGMNFTGGLQRVLITDGWIKERINSAGEMQLTAEVLDPFYRLDGNGRSVFAFRTVFDGNEITPSFQVGDLPWIMRDSSLPDGDANQDGVVDLADMNEVRNRFGRTFPQASGYDYMLGDTNPYDGFVDLTDLNRVRNNFGTSQAVPEPSAILLCLICLAGVHVWHRRPGRRCSVSSISALRANPAG